jgi:hypothetical protein
VFPEDSAQFASQKIWFPASRPENVSYRSDAQLSKALAVWTTCHTVRTPIKLKHHQSRRRGFLSGPPLCREASNCTSLRPFGRFISPDDSQCSTKASRFLSKTQIWEDCYNHPDDMDSLPDALIHKASITIQIQTSGRQSSWSGRTCIK